MLATPQTELRAFLYKHIHQEAFHIQALNILTFFFFALKQIKYSSTDYTVVLNFVRSQVVDCWELISDIFILIAFVRCNFSHWLQKKCRTYTAVSDASGNSKVQNIKLE